MWDILTGHICTGQDSLSAAYREINEEISIDLGYRVDIKDFRYMFSFRKEQVVSPTHIDRQFYDFFILRKHGINAAKISFQESEVQAVELVGLSGLKTMIKNHSIVERTEVYAYLFDYLFRC